MRGRIAVVGTAESDLGEVAPGITPVDLMAQAACRALDDCGLSLRDVDGVFAATGQVRLSTLALCQYLGIHPRYSDATVIGGSSFMAHVLHAAAAIEAGLCEVALVAYGSTQRTIGRSRVRAAEPEPYESPYRPILPAAAYALATSRYFREFGATREQLAEVAVAARQWALLNPAAWEKEPLTVEQVLGARMVCDPLTVRDCCLVTDGGGAIVLTSAERARSLKRPPAYVLGAGEALSHQNIACMENLTTTAAVESGRRAYEMAGVSARDVDVAQLYDAFTITPILFLEDLGFCPKGEGARFVGGGRIAPGGELPLNTNGGGLSYCHPGMYGLLALIEAVRQVQGVAGKRQVAKCDVALAHGNGGVLSSQSTVILGGEAAL
ncbi:acetyl-CoA acetyltransferase [Pigmentiphaga soli]|uniref:acetyl-CoA acetyltransferase n=1 Tax=Pigmentiphaga soli TaxID=1007095 RepID=UPI0031E8A450